MKLSVIILTKNEEKNIVDCLESVSWADEIIIVDDNSTDRTLEVIKSFPVFKKIKVYINALNQNFANQRNFGLSKAISDWVLFLDADERITPDLKQEINDLLILGKIKEDGFLIQRRDILWGRMLRFGETGKIKFIRMAKKHTQGLWEGKVHEQWVVEGRIGELDNYIIHFPHQKIHEFLNEINIYTSIRAKELFTLGIKTNVWQIIAYPKAKFILNYFLKRGFLDGIEGLVFAIIMSFHSFLVRAKLWILWKKI